MSSLISQATHALSLTIQDHVLSFIMLHVLFFIVFFEIMRHTINDIREHDICAICFQFPQGQIQARSFKYKGTKHLKREEQ